MLAAQQSCPHCQQPTQAAHAECGCGCNTSHTIALHDHHTTHDSSQDVVKLFDELSDQTAIIRQIQVQIMRKVFTYVLTVAGAIVLLIAGVAWFTKSIGLW